MLVLSTALADFGREGAPSADRFGKQVLDLGGDGVWLDRSIPPARAGSLVRDFRVAGCGVEGAEAPVGDGPPLCETDADRRRFAAQSLRRAIERAAELEVRLIQVTLGRMPFGASEDAVQSALDEDGLDSPAVERALRAALERRSAFGSGALDGARRSLDELCPIAERLGIRLAIRQGEGLFDVPSFHEAAGLFRELEGAPLGLWFDTASAYRIEKLGLRRSAEWLEQLGSRTFGGVCRDALWKESFDEEGLRNAVRYQGGLVPGEGEIDFERIGRVVAEQVKQPAIWCLELHSGADLGRVRDAVRQLRGAGLG